MTCAMKCWAKIPSLQQPVTHVRSQQLENHINPIESQWTKSSPGLHFFLFKKPSRSDISQQRRKSDCNFHFMLTSNLVERHPFRTNDPFYVLPDVQAQRAYFTLNCLFILQFRYRGVFPLKKDASFLSSNDQSHFSNDMHQSKHC